MARAIFVLSGSTVALLHNPVVLLAQRLAAARRVISHDVARHYHPERHYMRGPGPAWQAKQREDHGAQPQA